MLTDQQRTWLKRTYQIGMPWRAELAPLRDAGYVYECSNVYGRPWARATMKGCEWFRAGEQERLQIEENNAKDTKAT